EMSVRDPRQLLHSAIGEHGAVAPGLFAQPDQKLAAADAVRKSRIIVRSGYERCTAAAAIHDTHIATEPRQVDRGSESGRTAANDQAVAHAHCLLSVFMIRTSSRANVHPRRGVASNVP